MPREKRRTKLEMIQKIEDDLKEQRLTRDKKTSLLRKLYNSLEHADPKDTESFEAYLQANVQIPIKRHLQLIMEAENDAVVMNAIKMWYDRGFGDIKRNVTVDNNVRMSFVDVLRTIDLDQVEDAESETHTG